MFWLLHAASENQLTAGSMVSLAIVGQFIGCFEAASQLKGSVQQPDNFNFYSFGKTQLKFSIVEKTIFVTNIRKNTPI